MDAQVHRLCEEEVLSHFKIFLNVKGTVGQIHPSYLVVNDGCDGNFGKVELSGWTLGKAGEFQNTTSFVCAPRLGPFHVIVQWNHPPMQHDPPPYGGP